MTLTSRKVHEAVEASRSAADFTASEDLGHLRVAGTLTPEALAAWQAVIDDQCSWLRVECTDEAQDVVPPTSVRDGERIRLSVRFDCSPAAAHLFTPEGWLTLLYDDERISAAGVVKLAFIVNGFETKAFSVEPWGEAPESLTIPSTKADAGPRRQVRCQSPLLMAPTRIEPWILRVPYAGSELAFSTWLRVAAHMILRSLPNELYQVDDIPHVSLSGQPPRRLTLGSLNGDIPFDVLQDAANWVYLEGADVEVRHTFLSAELAREWASEVSFSAGIIDRLAGALESARLVYKAHLRAGSKDTLKALADLRKTLAEEVQKLLQQARDLSSGVWRDVAVAIGVIAVRFALDNTKAGSATSGFAVIYLIVAIYVTASYAIVIAMNNRFLTIAEESRSAWRTKLYAFLDNEDYRALAEKPLRDALSAYRKTELRTTLVVIIVVLILLLGIAFELHWLSFDELWTAMRQAVDACRAWIAGKLQSWFQR